MSPRPDTGEEHRTEIIKSGINVFTRQGCVNTRIEDIAVDTGFRCE